jgi:hypothetical protein
LFDFAECIALKNVLSERFMLKDGFFFLGVDQATRRDVASALSMLLFVGECAG